MTYKQFYEKIRTIGGWKNNTLGCVRRHRGVMQLGILECPITAIANLKRQGDKSPEKPRDMFTVGSPMAAGGYIGLTSGMSARIAHLADSGIQSVNKTALRKACGV